MAARCTLGLSYKEVADKLHISLHTAKQHARVAFLRLGVNNSLAAAAILTARRG